MKAHCLVVATALLLAAVPAPTQEVYPIAYNLQFVPRYEYLNTMAMSDNNKEYYSIFVLAFQNKGNVRLHVNDEYEIVTSKGERHKPGFHPLVKKHFETKRNFSSTSGKLKFLDPGETKYQVLVFDVISDATPAFRLHVRGLPAADGTPNKIQLVADFEHLPQQIEKNPANARDPSIVWEKEPIPYSPNREVARWRMRQLVRAENK